MSLFDGQRVEQAVEVIGGRVLVAFAQVVGLVVAAPCITDHPIAGFGKERLLVSPNLGITCRGRMQKDHSLALAAGVGVENLPARQLGQGTFGRHLLGQGYGIHWIGGVIADKAFAHRILPTFIARFMFCKPPFFLPEQYRQTEELSIFFLFDENAGVAFCWLGRRSSRRAREVFRSHRSLELRPSERRWLAFALILSSATRVSKD